MSKMFGNKKDVKDLEVVRHLTAPVEVYDIYGKLMGIDSNAFIQVQSRLQRKRVTGPHYEADACVNINRPGYIAFVIIAGNCFDVRNFELDLVETDKKGRPYAERFFEISRKEKLPEKTCPI